MPPRAERSRLRLVAYGAVALLVVLAAIPGYLIVDAAWRPLALRLACAAIVVVGCTRVVGRVRRSMEDEPLSALDTPPPAPRRAAQDERFLRLREDVVFSRRSQRYFDIFLWPRLSKLGGPDLTPPAARRRGGPSLSALERVIAQIERRP